MTVLTVGKVFHMYYEAWGVRGNGYDWSDFTSLQIGHATSPDGIHWTKDPANPILPKGTGNDVVQDPNSKEAKRQRAKSKGSSAVCLPASVTHY
jgi:hypothetical protein